VSGDAREAWVYESLVGALPGVAVGSRRALFLQFGGFEAAVLACWWYYALPDRALLAGTVVVAVASVGSAAMTSIADAARSPGVPRRYRSLLLGTRVELLLALLAFVALVTYLFVADPRAPPALLAELLGPEPPVVVVYLALVLCWDVCYRIGAAWWASVTGCWRSLALGPGSAAASLRRADGATLAFGGVQLALVPFVTDHPLLAGALLGHVAAVAVLSGTALLALDT